MLTQILILLLAMLGLALPVAGAMFLIGVFIDVGFSPLPIHVVIGELAWSHTIDFTLIAIPFFILTGQILLAAGVAEKMYAAVLRWLSWAPGGLMHANIVACALFAATSGSSVATAATVGVVALPEVERHKYNERLYLGSLAAGGTLGILIPPSINMILYAMLTDTSIPQLYLAGFLPGLTLAGLFMITVAVICKVKPQWGGVPQPFTWKERLIGLPDLLPILALFLVVVGSIYAGLATATEAAALGVCLAALMAWHRKRLTRLVLFRAAESTMKTMAMITLILVAAYFVNTGLAMIGFVDTVKEAINSLGLSPLGTLLSIIGMYLVLGCIMEVLAMMLLTIPIVTPIVVHLGYDPVWFGIIVMLVCEMAQITPPVGLVSYVVQGIRTRGKVEDVFIGMIPFFCAMLVMVGLLIAFPQIALWLPSMFYGD